jgi:hypothetical protein
MRDPFLLTLTDSEQERLANIKRNQELLRDLDLVGHTKPSSSRRSGGAGSSRATKSKSKPRQPSKNSEPQRIQPRRTSNRLAGVEADSETLKRKYEVCMLLGQEGLKGYSMHLLTNLLIVALLGGGRGCSRGAGPGKKSST